MHIKVSKSSPEYYENLPTYELVSSFPFNPKVEKIKSKPRCQNNKNLGKFVKKNKILPKLLVCQHVNRIGDYQVCLLIRLKNPRMCCTTSSACGMREQGSSKILP